MAHEIGSFLVNIRHKRKISSGIIAAHPSSPFFLVGDPSTLLLPECRRFGSSQSSCFFSLDEDVIVQYWSSTSSHRYRHSSHLKQNLLRRRLGVSRKRVHTIGYEPCIHPDETSNRIAKFDLERVDLDSSPATDANGSFPAFLHMGDDG